MPIDHQPAHPPFLEPQCVAAAAAFGRASLAKLREAEEPGFKGTPEGAMKRKMADIYSQCMADMTRLAAELGQGGRR